jgi:hypothetical protein
MDDDLILNIAQDDRPATNLGGLKKGGRWTERCLICGAMLLII